MSKMFSDVLTGNEHRNNKEESLAVLIDKYGFSTNECIYIGDAISDVIASKEAGIQCMSAAWSNSADKEKLYEINKENVYESVADLTRMLIA